MPGSAARTSLKVWGDDVLLMAVRSICQTSVLPSLPLVTSRVVVNPPMEGCVEEENFTSAAALRLNRKVPRKKNARMDFIVLKNVLYKNRKNIVFLAI